VGGGEVFRILSDGDDRKIFLGLKCLIPGFFGGWIIWQVFFWVVLFKSGFFGNVSCYIS